MMESKELKEDILNVAYDLFLSSITGYNIYQDGDERDRENYFFDGFATNEIIELRLSKSKYKFNLELLDKRDKKEYIESFINKIEAAFMITIHVKTLEEFWEQEKDLLDNILYIPFTLDIYDFYFPIQELDILGLKTPVLLLEMYNNISYTSQYTKIFYEKGYRTRPEKHNTIFDDLNFLGKKAEFATPYESLFLDLAFWKWLKFDKLTELEKKTSNEVEPKDEIKKVEITLKNKKPIKWTGSKNSLIYLLYELKNVKGVIDSTHKELAQFLIDNFDKFEKDNLEDLEKQFRPEPPKKKIDFELKDD